jgi:hypothetical protein
MLPEMDWFKHAFATDSPGPAQPTDAQRVVVERVCREVVRRRLTAPALLALEMSRPLNYVTAQMLHFFQPFLIVLTDTAAYEQFTAFLEQRGSVDYIAGRLEAIEEGHGPTGTPSSGAS